MLGDPRDPEHNLFMELGEGGEPTCVCNILVSLVFCCFRGIIGEGVVEWAGGGVGGGRGGG